MAFVSVALRFRVKGGAFLMSPGADLLTPNGRLYTVRGVEIFTVSGKKCFLYFSTRLVFLISKAFDRFLIFQDILVYVSPFFENLDYVSYKGVSYKPYWVYRIPSNLTRPQ